MSKTSFVKMYLTDPNLKSSLRSEIHGRGLFCKRNIEAGEMVIEYAGTVIRSVLTDKREKYYDGKVRKHTLLYCLSLHNHTQLITIIQYSAELKG